MFVLFNLRITMNIFIQTVHLKYNAFLHLLLRFSHLAALSKAIYSERQNPAAEELY